MKRKCFGCRALVGDVPWADSACSLGYPTEVYKVNNLMSGNRPKVECPKPTTYKELLRCMKEEKYHG